MDRWEQTDPSIRFLGVTIDSRLSWMDHVDTLGGILSRAIYGIRRVQQTTGTDAARMAYFALFHSRMTYGLQVWGCSAHTKQVLKHQKKAVRAITNATQTTHCRPLFREYRILTV